MFGGNSRLTGSDGLPLLFRETWSRFVSNFPQWVLSSTSGPIARYGHGMAYDGSSSIVLYGGFDRNFTALGDTWTWGRLVGCVPPDTVEIHPGKDVDCFFDPTGGEKLIGWRVEGFVARPGAEDAKRPTFRAQGPGTATITVAWTDAVGPHEQTFTFDVQSGRPQ